MQLIWQRLFEKPPLPRASTIDFTSDQSFWGIGIGRHR
jgi:hypothetical protein